MENPPLILYVEDNADNRKLVHRVLRVSGFNVQGVPDGKSAFEFLATQTPDMILMDINLPDIDGYEITTQLRTRPELAKIPIVALTANVMKQDREKSLQAGCNGFIHKPINVDTLPDEILAYLNQSES